MKFRKTMTAAAAISTALVSAPPLLAAEDGVTVGVLVPLTGELGEFGKIVADAVQLGVDEVNAAGGTRCGPLSIAVADTGGSAEQAIREANKMIDTEHAVAILGPASGEMVALVDLAKRKKTPMMSPYAGTITLNEIGGDYVYRTVSSDLGDGAASGLWLTEKGYKRVAFLVQNEESTISPAQVAKAAVEAAGIELTDFIIYNPGQPSYQAELISVLAHDPDAIYLAGGQESGVTVLKEAASGGFEGEWLLTADLAVPEVFESVDPRVLNDRAYVEIAEADSSLPEFKAFSELTMEKTGKEPGPFAANSYDMAMLTAISLEAADACTGEALNAALRGVTEGGEKVSTFAAAKQAISEGKDVDYEGAAGPLTMDESGTPAGAYMVKKATDGAWVDEKFYAASSFE
ncbi:ABC transporter substrate-binding protein [Paracoccus seriniphilus]|uniref:Branched-chain amino acid transport system substrate-binding protein n=1 Tax=Paracoccus seriniphilus TaxID=184748 RepID=A0A239PTH2_9RHOB|nr:ABC transporter substrate-binding protein [Paracoccus seriniphilus]WCR16380.1 ABC transporter substrate-binding protein [Paracoccus seriniphilus]SNT73428.1 branched-chain amino acid transport system substrate-binding protein [Paracoccus seriniphilus]